jgi:hypothetical protein
MSTAVAPKRTVILLGLAAFAILGIWFAVRPKTVLQGWHIAVVFLSGIPIGSLALLLIHRLTGGRWGVAFALALATATATMPLFVLFFVPVFFSLSMLYPWAADPSALRPAVTMLYLNHSAFVLRSVVALIGWSVLALWIVRGRSTIVVAALGLVFHGVAMSFIGVDWVLSIEPTFSSSSFAAAMAVQQMLSALAFVALTSGVHAEPRAREDLGALMMATLLGTVYLDYMSYVVIWYGNLPEKVAWYVIRGHGGWRWLLLANVLVGLLLPFCLLLTRRGRQSPFALRAAAGLLLFGVFLHVVWLIAPTFDLGAVVASMVAVVALGCLAAAAAEWVFFRSGAAYAD